MVVGGLGGGGGGLGGGGGWGGGVLLETLQNKFDIIVLPEAGARNLSTVECLLHNYGFHYISSKNNMFSGAGLYISDSINNVQVIEDVTATKTCNCKNVKR